MKLTDDQIATVEKEIDRILDFCAKEMVTVFVETLTDDQLQDSQRIFDMFSDHMNGKDLTKIMLDKLRKNMEVR